MDGALWRLFCGFADRSRARRVPLQGLVPYGPSPLTAEECLDPTCAADPSRFYPAPPPIRPDVWETIEEADRVFERLAALWATGDPTRYAARSRRPRLLMLNATTAWSPCGSPRSSGRRR